jgi:hypothetical protein
MGHSCGLTAVRDGTGRRRLAGAALVLAFGASIVLAAAGSPAARASQIISTSGVAHVVLGVNDSGEAMVSYVSRGKTVHVLAWGAENAIASQGQQPASPPATLELAYDGGYTKYFRDDPASTAALDDLHALQAQASKAAAAGDNKTRWALGRKISSAYAALAALRDRATNYWRTFSCPSYGGPSLKGVAIACEAPDGSYWALESRTLLGGTGSSAAGLAELQLAHWAGGIQGEPASRTIKATTVTDVALGVNDKGEAMVTYHTGGKTIHVLAWTRESPEPASTPGAFRLAYDGGYTKYFRDNPASTAALDNLHALQAQAGKAAAAGDNKTRWALGPRISAAYAALARLRAQATSYWRTFSCPAYTGPPIADLVAACTAPDGSYWAVQSWDRDLPDYGVAPTVAQSQVEVHLSHWTGPAASLNVHVDWGYGGQWHHLWGTYTYRGGGVFGSASTSEGVPLDSFGRNIYVDTLDSAYGAGWRRENSFLSHRPGGSWCYSVNPHGSHPAGTGSEYRLTVLGPGVTPDVSVTVSAPGAYDKATQARANTALRAMGDPSCIPHDGS